MGARDIRQHRSGKDKNKAKHRAVPVHAIKVYGGYVFTSISNSVLNRVVSFISQLEYPMNRRHTESELVWMLDKRSLVPALLSSVATGTRSHKSGGFSAVPHKGDTGTSLSKSFQDNLLTDHRKNEAFTQKWKMKACFYLAALSV
jgi:hypothetical protein